MPKRIASLDDLRPDPHNLRQHGEDSIGMIAESLQTFGANRAIVVDEDGVVLAGNGVLEAARQIGIQRVKTISVDGNEVVAVQVKHLTEEQKRLYAVADNRAGELSSWDTDALAEAVRNGLDVSGYFFEDELQRLAGDLWRGEEDQSALRDLAERNQRNQENKRIEGQVVICPHCYHEWSLATEEGTE